MKRLLIFMALIFALQFVYAQSKDQTWPQFRGPNGSGIAAESAKPPADFEKAVLVWNTELPHGVSSPVIWNDKIFLTAFKESSKELLTMCLDRETGKELWTASIVPDTIEKFSSVISCPAQATVVTDGERVISYFGSFGLICYKSDGTLLWKYRIACNRGSYGSATSPVLTGDKVILLNDQGNPRYLLALNKTDGKTVWKTKIANPTIMNPGGQSVPCITDKKIFVHLVGTVNCYSVKDGSLISSYGFLTSGISSPVISDDKVIYAGWINTSEQSQRGILPGFSELKTRYDKNLNGSVSKEEFPADLILYTRPDITELPGATGTVKSFFGLFDTNKDNELTEQEWTASVESLTKIYFQPAGLIAISTQTQGTLSASDIKWKVTENIPEVPTPLYYRNRIYMIRDGGILSCVDEQTGKVIYTTRIGITGPFISSPVAANGNIYLTGFYGKMKVIRAGDIFEPVSQYDFKENIGATPAIIGNTIYIRTKTRLFAYSSK